MEQESQATSPKEKPAPRFSLGSESGLHYGALVNSVSSLAPLAPEAPSISPKRAYVAVAVLCYINLLNYMDRFAIAGVLLNIQDFFGIDDSKAALLQTVFICSFLLFAPLFGYLGDRYNRIYIMMFGISMWLIMSAGSSLVTQSGFWVLMALRALVGIGEASYTTIAPTIIGDLFTGSQLSAMICLFYIFIPIGSGLGYIVGSGITTLTGDWLWALRVTPIMGLFGLAALYFLCPNPPRGAADTHGEGVTEKSSYLDDIKYLLKNKSYLWSSFGVTATAFLTGAMAFWMPTFLSRARVALAHDSVCENEPCDTNDSLIFGGLTVVTGIVGGSLGSGLSRRFRDKWPNVDPIICATGLLGCTPFLFGLIFVSSVSIAAAYVLIAIGQILIALNWAVMADILLYVVVPTKRATAEALQISVLHLLGDAGSPFIVGAVSDAIFNSNPGKPNWKFTSLQYSFIICPIVGFLGGLFFVMASFYVIEDRKAARQLIEESAQPQQNPPSEPPLETSNHQK